MGDQSCVNAPSHEVGRIILYTTPECPRCALLKELLKGRGVRFEEKNLDDVDVMADLIMENKFILSAPALEVGGHLYSEDQIFDENGRVRKKILEMLG